MRVWRRSVPKMVLVLLACILFVVFGALMGLGLLGESDGLFARVVGWMAVLLGVVAASKWLRQLWAGDPVVVAVGPEGIHDRRLSAQPIPWDDIDGIAVHQVRRTRFLILRMTPEAVRRHVHSAPSKLGTRMYGGPGIATIGLDRSFDELVAAVSKWLPQNEVR
ncbi:hypothetical protein Pth03_74350 [Planotetraspora thailandica]|uniref:PH domain-containing protein n=1 Tax=Planotetraspora thailandica TaxID=487172 RepID=A0A8J3Y1H7_9ACTN|nr:hypothetical protein Pth03_74350 [Planotetraspora thailandica]